MVPHSKPSLDHDEIEAAVAVLQSGNVAVGPEIELFEKEVAAYIGKKYAVAVNNGTAALHLSLLAIGIGSGDEVIIPAAACPALLHAVEYTGAIPVICDVNEGDLNLNIKSTRAAINKNTKAIILPHMFGLPSDLDDFLSLDIPIIEDCAQSIGGGYKGNKLGSYGALSIFSFYATKLMTSVDGGMILTDDEAMADLMRDVLYYGGKRDYRVRYNYKMQNLNAAIGLVQLKKLDRFIAERKRQFQMLAKALETKKTCYQILKAADKGAQCSYYKLLIKFSCDATKEKYLNLCYDLGINTCPPIFVDLKAFKNGDGAVSDLPNMRSHMRNTYAFPIYPGIDEGALERFIDSADEILAQETL